jgi:glycosyltransferase involved in cell wall biosynthesis
MAPFEDTPADVDAPPAGEGPDHCAPHHPIRVAFAGGNGFPPEDGGGVQSSTDDMARRLLAQGDRPVVLAPLYGKGVFGWRTRTRLKLGRGPLVMDRHPGYAVYRAWSPEDAVAAFCDAAAPDVTVVQCHGSVPLAQAFRAAGVPVILYLRNVEFAELGGDPRTAGAAAFIANSRFTAMRYKEAFGINAHVIPPMIDPARFAVDCDGSTVVMINPVAEKGVDRAIEIAARCPDIPFLFVESWMLSTKDHVALERRIAPYPNIRFERRKPDVREVYARARIVLAPSVWEEAWGRVASEAQCSGLPVIGTDRGGLPEAIGPGGVVLPFGADTDAWVAEVRRLWDDRATHDAMSAAARRHASRPEIDAARQFKSFTAIVRYVLNERGNDRHKAGAW